MEWLQRVLEWLRRHTLYQGEDLPRQVEVERSETREYCDEIFNRIPVKKIEGAVRVLKYFLDEKTWKLICSAIDQFPEDWLYHLYDEEIAEARIKYGEDFDRSGMAAFYAGRGHFGFGMSVRNMLRNHKFGEKKLGVSNLDDVYVRILERAAAEKKSTLVKSAA